MREFNKLREVDVRLSLLKGASMKVENLVIKPYTLDEIEDYGYSNYMQNLQWISISVDDFISSIKDEGRVAILEKQREKLKSFDFYYKLGGEQMLILLIQSIKMIFRTDDVLALDDGVIGINFVKRGIAYKDENGEIQFYSEVLDNLLEDELTVIHRENFDDFVEVVKLQNYLTSPKQDKLSNPADEMTRQLMEQMEQNKKRVEAKKKAQEISRGEDSDIDIGDIISAVSSKSYSINKLNIWDFTLYQLYDEYSRLEIIDNYDFSLKAMMAGAKEVDLKHWSSKI